MKADADFYVQAIVSVLVITDPVTRGIFFKTMTEHEPERRVEYVRRITIAVGITLGVAAVAGREILDLLGINLGAFGIAGGLMVALMGFEMLFGGEPSRAQGDKGGARGVQELRGQRDRSVRDPVRRWPGGDHAGDHDRSLDVKR